MAFLGGLFGSAKSTSKPISGKQVLDVFNSVAPILGGSFQPGADGRMVVNPDLLNVAPPGTLRPQPTSTTTIATPQAGVPPGAFAPQAFVPRIAGTTIRAADPALAPPQAFAPQIAGTTIGATNPAAAPGLASTQISNLTPAQMANIASLPGMNFDPRLLGGGDFERLRQSILQPTQQLLETERQRSVDQTQEGLAQRGIFASPVSSEVERRVNEQYANALGRASSEASTAATQAELQQNNVVNQIAGALAGTQFQGGVQQNIAQGQFGQNTALVNQATELQAALAQAGITSNEAALRAQLGAQTGLAYQAAQLQTNLAQGNLNANAALNQAQFGTQVGLANQATAADLSKTNLAAQLQASLANLGTQERVGTANAQLEAANKTFNASQSLEAQKFNIMQKLGIDEAQFNRFAQLFGMLFSPAGSAGTSRTQGQGLGGQLLNSLVAGGAQGASAAGTAAALAKPA